jgi:hypothetical protein
MTQNFLSSRVTAVMAAWLDKHGHQIPFVDQAELISHVTQEIENKPALQAALESLSTAPVEKYCVIGIDAYQRTYHDTPAEAAQAAAVMIRDNVRREARQGGKTCKKMLVVKTVEVVEEAPPSPPFVNTREPVAADFIRAKPYPSRAWTGRDG